MKPIIQNNNKLNIKNFLYNLRYLRNKKTKEQDYAKNNVNLKVFKYFEIFNIEKENKCKIMKNNMKNNNSNKYTSSLKDLKEIIKKVSKSVSKEKTKLKCLGENSKKRKIKSANPNILKNNNYKKEKGNKKINMENEIERELNKKKIFNIKPIELNKIDLIIDNKRNMRYYINDNSNISLPPLLYSRPLFKYEKPILVGLNNLGFTCYLNAILQCLNQTEPLSNYFLSEEGASKAQNNNLKINFPSSIQISPAYLDVVKNLWDTTKNNKSYSPILFYEKLNEINNSFILNKPNDSKDLLKFLFKQFHKELNTKGAIINNDDNNNKEDSFEQYDRVKVFNKFLLYFTNNNCSIISNNFYGITEINKECFNCKQFFMNQYIILKPIIYEFKIYNMLIFPLDEIKKEKIKIIKNNEKINEISIYDCFEYYQKSKKLDKKIFCKRCNQLTEFTSSSKLFNAPIILIIILNRAKNNSYNLKIEFKEEINLTPFIQFKENKVIYELYGVVTHLGKNGDKGHFISSCKNLIDNNWYKYNDSNILKINNIQKEVLDFGKPYILFFQKKF